MTNCSVHSGNYSRSTQLFKSAKISVVDPCGTSPCGVQGRCIPLSAAPKGYMCVCQSESITFTTIDTCPSKFSLVDTKIKRFSNRYQCNL